MDQIKIKQRNKYAKKQIKKKEKTRNNYVKKQERKEIKKQRKNDTKNLMHVLAQCDKCRLYCKTR